MLLVFMMDTIRRFIMDFAKKGNGIVRIVVLNFCFHWISVYLEPTNIMLLQRRKEEREVPILMSKRLYVRIKMIISIPRNNAVIQK